MPNGVSAEPATVWFTKADGFELPLTGGNIFVMNDNGKTVARYNLVATDHRDPYQLAAPAAQPAQL